MLRVKTQPILAGISGAFGDVTFLRPGRCPNLTWAAWMSRVSRGFLSAQVHRLVGVGYCQGRRCLRGGLLVGFFLGSGFAVL